METIHEKVVHRSDDEPLEIIEPLNVQETRNHARVYHKKKDVFKAYQIVWYVWGIIEVLIAFRFILEGLGANPYSGFASFIYSLTHPMVAPFFGVFGTPAAGRYVFDWAAVIAFAVYTVIAYIIAYLLQIIYPVTPRDLHTRAQV